MYDSALGDYPEDICSDCREKGCTFKHSGSLVPEGEKGTFCDFCWERRGLRRGKGENPLPLGVEPPGIPKEFAKKTLRVITRSKAVYRLKPTSKKNEMVIFRDRGLHFSRARVMLLEIGERMTLKPRDGNDLYLWSTTPVDKIEPWQA